MRADAGTDRRRLVAALGLGPLWRLRDRSPVDQRDATPRETEVVRHDRIARLDWAPLRDAVATCVACDRSASRRHAVFGTGPTRPRWLVVGGEPDAHADACGEPFVGEAGRLLDAMLAASGLSRSRDVFVTELLRCRVPDDRPPSPVEVACCRPYLDRQIALLAPRLVLVLGETAGAALLGVDAGPGVLRRRGHVVAVEGRTVPVVVTHHPSDLLDSPGRKPEAWADLCLARSIEEEALAAASM